MASSNMKDIKRRIKSVESTRQITKAMELVASSKLRKAKEKADNAKPFFNTLYDTMLEIVSSDDTFDSIFTRNRKNNVTLLVVIGGDRGLAGGFNANVLKLAQQRYDELKKSGEVVALPIGRKSVEYFEKRNVKIMTRYENISESLTIYGAMSIADKIIDVYKKEKIDRVELFYTDCVSPLLQEARRMPLIPLEIEPNREYKGLTNYDPDPETVFDSLIPRYMAGVLFGAVVNSFAAEQAARRTAMENATDNANEMISDLSLMYNRARQAAITQEITEIVGGASAQE
ncbi:MAG: ATP synthase F1 subunit gamma [Clostridium sp.]|nr:ATP synthase F1 subunit gamma [Clostridium sp.]MCM1548210.1 ATP synthase F1 subunit gamma [Ruminococcus sp.]